MPFYYPEQLLTYKCLILNFEFLFSHYYLLFLKKFLCLEYRKGEQLFQHWKLLLYKNHHNLLGLDIFLNLKLCLFYLLKVLRLVFLYDLDFFQTLANLLKQEMQLLQLMHIIYQHQHLQHLHKFYHLYQLQLEN